MTKEIVIPMIVINVLKGESFNGRGDKVLLGNLQQDAEINIEQYHDEFKWLQRVNVKIKRKYNNKVLPIGDYNASIRFSTIYKITTESETKHTQDSELTKRTRIVYEHYISSTGANMLFGSIEESKRLPIELGEDYILEITKMDKSIKKEVKQ